MLTRFFSLGGGHRHVHPRSGAILAGSRGHVIVREAVDFEIEATALEEAYA